MDMLSFGWYSLLTGKTQFKPDDKHRHHTPHFVVKIFNIKVGSYHKRAPLCIGQGIPCLIIHQIARTIKYGLHDRHILEEKWFRTKVDLLKRFGDVVVAQ